ncbi:replication factor C large subunit [Archaeoglobus fulgidus]|jgi:replication factor C large subunit|uniref:Replication factor C large subunit n=3 Tax=Archaeoglobus fulgidus TaxID=2234 RepID=RFCL_ARCFU|nr:replication factor C large subunit [Archaeoglobus fulgidus]O29072.1 RecName: Full=Replication factor C large subunit; Short=RFC large subunit; AltName: Full=Clamp loader large subunit; AltName: Full=afRFC large subunit; Short=afRFCla [Archaeoglobus fulgidus DSM 4304]AAB90051.1 activator 1, replication factor C, 53 KD subunit [Archaeoglobus fulgidus DSM 4304]AIG98069.1 DNA polymerase III, gamma/tau subunit [Archaeoglobus fulgidus DSM 8774]KUJ93683.1 MAG: Replication factor C large subunit [Ar
MLWVEKYRPKTLEEVVADKSIITRVIKWAKSWKRGSKPLLLAGPPGVGKTSLALALANTMGWEAVELNASDQRSWRVIERIVGEGAFNETISDEGEFLSSRIGKLKLIILDEVDNIHKKEDVGGEAALIRLIKRKPAQPLILIANDPYKLSPELRNLCEMINFKRLTKQQVARVLERIALKEGIKVDKSVLLKIAENAGGDLRAAINDFQALAEGKEELKPEDVFLTKRTQEKDIFRVMQMIFKTKNPAVYNEAMLLDESPEDVIHWVDENLPLEYSGVELVNAYEALSRADIFLGRVRRRQFYRLWKYASYLMTVGVQQMKEEPKKGFTRYRRPAVWQMLFQLRQKREMTRKILEKIGKYSHLSMRKARTEMFPVIKLLLKELDVDKAATIAAFYEFTKEELEFLVGEKGDEIWKYVEKHGMHRIEDETFLESFVKAEKEEKEESVEEVAEEKPEEEREEPRARKKAGKNLTLDSFFS